MKQIIGLLCLPAILLSGGLKSSLLQAKKQQKPLMVMVTSDVCRYCDEMKDKTLTSSIVKKNMKGFLFTTVDKDHPEAQRYLFAKKEFEIAPTIFFVSPKFKIVNRVDGYLKPHDFNDYLKDTRAQLNMDTPSSTTTTTTLKSGTWVSDIDSGIDHASQTGKQVMVFVGSSRSKWSKELERTTLKNAKVKKALKSFVWVKIEHGDSSAKAYGINPENVPAVYFMTADMRELVVAKGYFGVDDFLLYVNHAKAQI